MKAKPSHKPWRGPLDDFIIRIYGWGKMADIVRGYDVRIQRSYGEPHQYFSIQNYGSERAALKAARAHRDQVVAKHRLPVRRAGKRRIQAFALKPRSNNKSGIVGVTYQKWGGGYWLAYYHPEVGNQKRRSWAVRKYTHDGAKLLAQMWRAEQIAKLRRRKS